ncbi:MAG: 4-hydroxy-tetrahydrodipicolinate reductase [Brevinematales bacterium]|nr:4-hydroxy-tetrahydrodipicolinate reductase [Brevinematales bacterium]
MTKVCVTGAAGKMGKTNINVILSDKEATLSGAVEAKDSPFVGLDAGEVAGCGKIGIKIEDSLEKVVGNCDVVIDFTSIHSFDENLSCVLKNKKAFVCGTTGLSNEQIEKAKQAGNEIPIIWAPNFSVGITLLNKITAICAEVLKENFDPEIMEIHHKMKKDAPSGTAIKLLNTLKKIYNSEDVIYGREGLIGERPPKQIGVSTLRGGDVVGEHTVYFFGQGERIELTHKASSRETFARGALRAAKYIVAKGKGFYTMEEILGLN